MNRNYFSTDGTPIENLEKYLKKKGASPSNINLFKDLFEMFSQNFSEIEKNLSSDKIDLLKYCAGTFYRDCIKKYDILPPVSLLQWLAEGLDSLFEQYEREKNKKNRNSLEELLGLDGKAATKDALLQRDAKLASMMRYYMNSEGLGIDAAATGVSTDLEEDCGSSMSESQLRKNYRKMEGPLLDTWSSHQLINALENGGKLEIEEPEIKQSSD